MEYLVSCVAFALLLLGHMIPEGAADSVKPNYDYASYKFFDIRTPLVLSCKVILDPPRNYTLEWFKENKPVSEDSGIKDRFKLIPQEDTFVIEKAYEADGGNYTCQVVNTTDLKANIEAVAKPYTKLPPNTSVVEGESLKITCQGYGNPKPVIEWTIGNETYKESKGRVTLADDNGVANAILTMSNITLNDRGNVTCKGINIASQYINTTEDSTFVRVIDKLAALWPFLGICAEVFVLCAIILIYEKRRNKPDMEESDTDQSPDQKQTPDHGKDVRHRK